MKRSPERLDDLALVALGWVIALGTVATFILVGIVLIHGGTI